jgi:hypothetical protein
VVYLKCILVLDNIGVFEFLQDGDFPADFLFGGELSVHFFDGDFSTGFDVLPTVDLSEGALPNTVLLCEDIIPHLDLHLLIHQSIL